MRTITDSVYDGSPTPANQAYESSVPLSVYRQLAAELQAAQAAIHQLNFQNEHLAQENYVLRQEITNTVNAVLHLQNSVTHTNNTDTNNTAQNSTSYPSFDPTVETPQKRYPPENTQYKRQNKTRKRAKRPPTRRVVPQVTEFIESPPEPVFIEEQQASYYYVDDSVSQVRGWWLIFAIVLIIVMGFGAGYVVVRPLLEHHTR